MMSRAFLGLGVMAGCAARLGAADEPSRSVFVSAGTLQVAKGEDKELKMKANDAYKARKEAEKKLKEQFGKKREAWPPEKAEELHNLEEAQTAAMAAWQYRKIDPKAVADAIRDLNRAAQGKGMQAGKKNHIVLASSAAEADVLVEVLGRRSESKPGAFTPAEPEAGAGRQDAIDCWVLFSIGRGERTAAARFARIPAGYRPRTSRGQNANRIAGPTAERPTFMFEGYSGGGSFFGCHEAAANGASSAIDRFIEDNYANLVAK